MGRGNGEVGRPVWKTVDGDLTILWVSHAMLFHEAERKARVYPLYYTFPPLTIQKRLVYPSVPQANLPINNSAFAISFHFLSNNHKRSAMTYTTNKAISISVNSMSLSSTSLGPDKAFCALVCRTLAWWALALVPL